MCIKTRYSIIFVSSVLIQLALSMLCWPAEVLNCGDILLGKKFAKDGERHQFVIEMKSGESLKLSVSPVGDYLRARIKIHDASGREMHDSLDSIKETDDSTAQNTETSKIQIQTGILSFTGEYTITVFNRGIGEYRLSIGCIEREGTEIGPHRKIYSNTQEKGDSSE